MHAVDERTIRRWSEDDDDPMPRNSDGTYNAGLTIGWRIRYEGGAELDLTQERARLAKEQADKTAMDNAVKRGELLRVSTVAKEWSHLIGPHSAKLLGMPRKLSPRLAAMKNANAINDCLSDEIRNILAAWADYQPGSGEAGDEETGRVDAATTSTTPEMDGQPVGRRKAVAKRGKQRGTRPLAN